MLQPGCRLYGSLAILDLQELSEGLEKLKLKETNLEEANRSPLADALRSTEKVLGGCDQSEKKENLSFKTEWFARVAQGKLNWRPLCRRRVRKSRSSTNNLLASTRPLGCRLLLSMLPFQRAKVKRLFVGYSVS